MAAARNSAVVTFIFVGAYIALEVLAIHFLMAEGLGDAGSDRKSGCFGSGAWVYPHQGPSW
jgi:hypothetical protein